MQQVFDELKKILKSHEKSLSIVHDKSNNYYLNTPVTVTNKKGEIFGAVQIKKNYVAFHLMPIYYNPNLLDNISDELKNKMQGKSCFNFKAVDKKLFIELQNLSKRCFKEYALMKKV